METKRELVAMILWDKIGFKSKTDTKEKTGHYIMINDSIIKRIYYRYILINIQASNISSKYWSEGRNKRNTSIKKH